MAQHFPLCSSKACRKESLGELERRGEPLLASADSVRAGMGSTAGVFHSLEGKASTVKSGGNISLQDPQGFLLRLGQDLQKYSDTFGLLFQPCPWSKQIEETLGCGHKRVSLE